MPSFITQNEWDLEKDLDAIMSKFLGYMVLGLFLFSWHLHAHDSGVCVLRMVGVGCVYRRLEPTLYLYLCMFNNLYIYLP